MSFRLRTAYCPPAPWPPFGTTSETAGLSGVSTLVAPWRPMIISLEVLDSVNRAAGRMRFAPKLPSSEPSPEVSP